MKADIEFRRWKRWQLAYDQQQGKIGRADRALQSAFSVAYELITGFGYKPLRFVAATITLFLAVAIINMLVLPGDLRIDNNVLQEITLVDSIFYTFSMMTVLGFSTIVPLTSTAKLLTVSQALAGVGWMGLFTSLLVKRFIK